MFDVRRREFIKLFGGAAAAWPLSARGQQPAGKMSRVGILSPAGSEAAGTLAAFRQGMRRFRRRRSVTCNRARRISLHVPARNKSNRIVCRSSMPSRTSLIRNSTGS
jgi:hypothetical protein